MSIYLARHGETDWNIARRIQGTTETELNARGLDQAKLLYGNLRAQNAALKAVFTSGQNRARTTAGIVAAGYDVPVIPVKGLEEMNLGVFEGHTWEEVMALYPDEFAFWAGCKRTRRPPGGETYQEVADRLAVALKEILATYDSVYGGEGDVLIISHGAMIMTFLTILKDLDFADSYKQVEVKNATAIKVEREDVEGYVGKT